MTTRSPTADPALMRRPRALLPLRTLVGFVVAIVAVIGIAIVSLTSLENRTSSAELVTQTLELVQQTDAVVSSVKDAETGERGYLLTGEEPYLEPYLVAKARIAGELDRLRRLTAGNARQQGAVATLEGLVADKMQEIEQTIALRRGGDQAAALAMVRSDRGKAAMDRIRAVAAEMKDAERAILGERRAQWREMIRFSNGVTGGGLGVLLFLILAAAYVTSRDYREREREAWLRNGQVAFSLRLEGEQRLDRLGENALQFLASYLDAQVGAVYVSEGDDFRRVATYALPAGKEGDVLRSGEGLLGQAAKENRPLRVRDVPADYLPIGSSLGRSQPRELLIAPGSVHRRVQAVIELGFVRRLDRADAELLARVSESLGVAVRSSRDRTRLEELLAETQSQAEELQAQQEELRTINEELEEQSRALKESQTRLESQHAELEQTNAQLEEQTELLESQRDDLVRTQGALSAKAAELERSNQYKSEFLANMSHELRTPLNSSLILAKLLADNKDGNLTESQIRYAQIISSAGHDLLALINDILDLSKIEAGKIVVEPEPVTIASAVEGLAKALQPIAEQKGLRFESTVDPRTPERMETDPQRLGQILTNLLSNAIKFTQHGEVSLHVAPGDAANVTFRVRDTGVGIPDDQHELIFEAFRQADGSTHRRYGGTGLGLSISRDLARLLGGDVTLESAPDQGSTFTLTLPLVHAGPFEVEAPARPATATPAPVLAAARPRADASARPSAERGRSLRPAAPAPLRSGAASVAGVHAVQEPNANSRLILIVEDDPHFSAILRDLAQELDFQCVVAHSANDGMAAAATYRPSAILLDVNLPDHSGLGVLDRLKSDPQTRHIPVHMISVEDHAREAYQLGAVGYALKPVHREQLVDAFRRLEAKLSQDVRRVLVVEDDERQRQSIDALLASEHVEIVAVETADEALRQLRAATFDCMVMDLNLPDQSGFELLERMARQEGISFPPVIVYTGRLLGEDEEHRLRRFASSIIIKDARSPERLLDEVTLFLHQVESELPPERRRMLRAARDREAALDGRRILVVEDDVRNVFALTSLLEPKGARIEVARNGKEALEALARSATDPEQRIDLVLMDIMMPEMDGLTAMREIRKETRWRRLPIIALTAKATKDDQRSCLDAGANDYIAKPLEVERLLSLIRVWMPKQAS